MPRTGPRTPSGKAITRLNALTHGLTSASVVIPGLESEEEWLAFRAAMLAQLEPEGAVEVAFAEEVVSLFWRKRRVVRFEAMSIAVYHESAEDDYEQRLNWTETPTLEAAAELVGEELQAGVLLKRIPTARARDTDPVSPGAALAVLTAAVANAPEAIGDLEGFPPGDDLLSVKAWHLALLRTALEQIARREQVSLADLCKVAARYNEANIEERARRLERLRDGLARLKRQRILPEERVLRTIIRHEAHLDRALYRAMHELEALQSKRKGERPAVSRLQVHGLPGA